MGWTKEQQAAIDFPSGSAIVSAAAGSGKTAILVERILRIIKDEENYTPADEIAVVTFTKKAAEELRSRLNAAITKQADSANSDFLRNQLIRFQSAKISTISSFCLDIIRNNIQKADLPVNFMLLDETQGDILLDRAAESTLDRLYEEFSENAINAVCDYFVNRDDSRLAEQLISLHTFMSNLIDPTLWKIEQADYYKNSDLGFEHFSAPLKIKALEIANYVHTEFEKLISTAAEYDLDDIVNVLDGNRDSFALLGKYIESNDYNGIIACCSEKLCRYTKEMKASPIGEKIHARRDKLNKKKKTIPYYIFSKEDFKADCEKQLIVLETLFRLCDIFDEEYIKLKQSKNSIDFNDIEHKLLELLKSDSAFAHKTAEEYSCIIVDEFQDSNDIQFEIFKLISKNEQNLFFVGDVKQSIYGFRAANPKNFAAICKNSNYKCLPLNSNFRSRREVVDTVNLVFNGFMTEECGDVNYDDNCKLNYKAEYVNGEDNSTEIHFLTTEDYIGSITDDRISTNCEASFVAEKIEEMLHFGFQVQDKNGGLRPCRKSDFCILLRSTKDKAKIFVDKLKEAGIESVSGGLKDYLALSEVSLVLSLLTVLDNPLKDNELLSVLMSPLYMMTADEIAAIRLGICGFNADKLEKIVDMNPIYDMYKSFSLYTCVSKCAAAFDTNEDTACFSEAERELIKQNPQYVRTQADEKCARFIKDFLELRAFMSNNSIERLVRKIYDSTDFLSVISVYEYSGQKVANLRRLLGYVSSFEKSSGGMLSDFLRYINEIKESKSDMASVNIVSEGNDAVSVMTIHGSKGLEFPIVFLCDLNKKLNKNDEKATIVCHPKMGIGMDFIDRQRLLKYHTLAHEAVKLEIDKQLRSEEMRLLYVAMTRAREKLIITCCSESGLDDFIASTADSDGYSPLNAVSGQSVLDWIECSLSRYFTPEDFIGGGTVFEKENLPIKLYKSTYLGVVNKAEKKEIAAVSDMTIVKRISDNLNYKYANQELTKIPQKFTATDLAKDKALLEQYSEAFSIYLPQPEFMESNAISGKQVGDAYHHAMEHINYNDVSLDGIKEQLINFAECGIISDKEYGIIKPEKLEAFFCTELGKRVCASARVEREYPIFMEIPYEQINVKSDSKDTPVVQGIADLFFFEGDEIVLVDYKSDSAENLEKMLESYKKQVSIYKTALEKTFGKRVKQCFIYSFSASMEIDIT